MLAKVNKLSDKAMLVRLSQKKVALTKRDALLTQQLQTSENDKSLTVLMKLFKAKDSPVNAIMQANAAVYGYHKKHTLPYVDAGPRILPNALYFEYTQEMKQHIAEVDKQMALWMPYYDQLVLDDVAFRNSGCTNGKARACVSEYPTAAQFEQSMRNDLRFLPMPDVSHFLFDLNEEDQKAFTEAEQQVAAAANADTLNRMLKPLHALVERLKEYQGLKGERFHNSVVENVIEGCQDARKLALNPPKELLDEIQALEDAARGYLDTVEVIKGSAIARDDARRQLAAVAAKMAAFA